jgi:lysophospholipase L1-like esterase
LHRAYARFSCDNIQYDESYLNNVGLFIDDYVNAVKEAGSLYACEVIDLFSVSGIYPLSDVSAQAFLANTETDRLHPSAKGHERIADVIERYL